MNRHRRMRDPAFRQQQWDQLYAPHIAPLNQLVKQLRREAKAPMPYVAPIYGGIHSQVLFMFQDPGPGTDDLANGSGFLCVENDDPSAQRFAECMDAAGLSPGRVVTWNAYPWRRADATKGLSAAHLEAGVEATVRLLALLPELRVVILMGRKAQDGWRRLGRRHPALAQRYEVLQGLHTSNLGIVAGGRTRAEGEAVVQAVMRRALEIVGPETCESW